MFVCLFVVRFFNGHLIPGILLQYHIVTFQFRRQTSNSAAPTTLYDTFLWTINTTSGNLEVSVSLIYDQMPAMDE